MVWQYRWLRCGPAVAIDVRIAAKGGRQETLRRLTVPGTPAMRARGERERICSHLLRVSAYTGFHLARDFDGCHKTDFLHPLEQWRFSSILVQIEH